MVRLLKSAVGFLRRTENSVLDYKPIFQDVCASHFHACQCERIPLLVLRQSDPLSLPSLQSLLKRHPTPTRSQGFRRPWREELIPDWPPDACGHGRGSNRRFGTQSVHPPRAKSAMAMDLQQVASSPDLVPAGKRSTMSGSQEATLSRPHRPFHPERPRSTCHQES